MVTASSRAFAPLVTTLAAISLLAGCSNGGSSEVDTADPSREAPTEPAGALSEEWCATWVGLYEMEDTQEIGQEMRAELDTALAMLDELADGAPDEHRGEVDDFAAALRRFHDLAAVYDFDEERLQADATPEEGERFLALADEIAEANVFAGTLAAMAYQECQGAPDPAFVLRCVVHRFEPVGPRPDAATTHPPNLPDPDTVADEILDGLEDAVEWRHRESEAGLPEYAFLDDEGETVVIAELQPTPDQWMPSQFSCP